MLYYTLVFLLISLVAGALGFWGVAGTAAYIARVLFVVFLVLFLISLIRGKKKIGWSGRTIFNFFETAGCRNGASPQGECNR